MSKQVLLGTEARNKMIKGIDTLADAVVVTLGPNGRNAVYTKGNEVFSTKDGVTVAKSIELSDPIEQAGVQLIRQASEKTADRAGDGTTTATLLAREIVKGALPALANGENAVQIKREVDQAVSSVVDTIRDTISEDISSDDQLKQIATISANNDSETGNLIATAIDKVGMEGVVHIEESRTGETYLETVEGLQFNKGYKSPYFVTDNNTMTATLENPFILLVDGKLTQVKELLPILEGVSQQARSLVIIADDIDNEALAALIVNKMRGTLRVVAVQAPEFGDRRKLVMEDIAITTGGTVFSKDKGMKFDRFSYDWFGEARSVKVAKEQTTIIDGKGEQEAIDKRVEEIETQIGQADTPYAIEKLQDRLAKLVGGVAIIHVGGLTEAEMHEKKDRVDDALHATKAAIEQGIVPGGGRALLDAASLLEKDCCTGNNIVIAACGKPFEQILTNAGIDNIKAKMLAQDLVEDSIWQSYDIKTDEVVDFREAGIIDPAKVTIEALQNAASVAGTILLTETVIVDEPKEEQTQGVDPNQFM
jgi:chaperonin GroEL